MSDKKLTRYQLCFVSSDLRIFIAGKHAGIFRIKHFNQEKLLFNIFGHKGFMGTLVNRALPSLAEGLLKITLKKCI